MNGEKHLPVDVLVDATRHRRIDRILWLHRTDRWYFGDFVRHAAWLGWACRTFPAATIDLASHPAYLPVYADDRFGTGLDQQLLGPDRTAAYDLVIEPGSFPPPDRSGGSTGPRTVRLLSWDAGWAVHDPGGRVVAAGSKAELNYFRAAHPGAVTGHRSIEPTAMRLRPRESETGRDLLDRILPGPAPVVVYNPTSSNPFTRETDLRKEVGNRLSVRDHAAVLRRLLVLLPGHRFLVGAPVKPGDRANRATLSALTRLVGGERVTALTVPGEEWVLTLRGFATILADPRICASVGAGTGSNTHLATLVGRHGLSIERGCDAQMLRNWSQDGFRMGSFRWRNPSPGSGIRVLNWPTRTVADLHGAAHAFMIEHALEHTDLPATLFTDPESVPGPVERFSDHWPHDPVPAVAAAVDLQRMMRPTAAAHYGDFTDEAAFLAFSHDVTGAGLQAVAAALVSHDPRVRSCAMRLFEDSNLHKLLIRLNHRQSGVPARPERRATARSC